MLSEILLLSVIVVTAYWGPMVLRRGGPEQRLYGWMLVGNLIAALLALLSRDPDRYDPISELLGAVAIGACVFLVMVPPVLRDLAGRLYRRNRLGLARRLVDLRELLQPGMGARQESEVIGAIVAVRDGRLDEAIGALRTKRSETEEPLARRRIDERIVMTFLYAAEWKRAIEHFESFQRVRGPVSPQTLTEMVRAYCEAGEMEQAAELLERLEASPLAEEPLFFVMLNRARLAFLAFAGRTSAVETLVAPSSALGSALPAAARSFWSGVARLNAGDRTTARDLLRQAADQAKSDVRAKELARGRLEAIDEPGVAGPHAFAPPVAELADRLVEAVKETPEAKDVDRPPRLVGVGLRDVPVTSALIALNGIAAVVVAYFFGSTTSEAGLVRAANLGAGVAAGEWWRLVSGMFMHIGVPHLLLNMYGLWVLGKLMEQQLGRTRFFAVYMIAGVAGSVASFLFSPHGVSAGASGAVLGLAGAALVELGGKRAERNGRWGRGLFGLLLFLVIANVAIGFRYAGFIDQAAHLGGLVAGALASGLLSPHWRFGGSFAVRGLAALVALCGVAATGYAGFAAATQPDYGRLLRQAPAEERVTNGLAFDVPQQWVLVEGDKGGDGDGEGPKKGEEQGDAPDAIFDSALPIGMVVLRGADADLDDVIDGRLEAEVSEAQDTLEAAAKPVEAGDAVKLAPGWRSRDVRFEPAPGRGISPRRIIAFGKRYETAGASELWVGIAWMPESMVDEVAPVLADVLASARLARDAVPVAAEPGSEPEPEPGADSGAEPDSGAESGSDAVR